MTYAYDDDGLLMQAGSVTYTRDAANGLLTGATLGAANSAFTYNGFGELVSQTSTHGGSALYSATYTRDAGGRLASQTQTIGGTTTVDAYTYDLAGRLTSVTRNGVALAQYAYDANGNRTSVASAAGAATATYDAQDRILTFGARSYTHSAHGDVANWTEAGATTTLTYDTQGNLLQVELPEAMTVTYVVDGRNRRIRRLVNGVATQGFLYQGQLRPVAELDGSGVPWCHALSMVGAQLRLNI